MDDLLMTTEDLIESADTVTGGDVKDLSLDQLQRLMTITQYVTDLCLNEIERRGELTFAPAPKGGLVPIVPYRCEHMVETILTRPGGTVPYTQPMHDFQLSSLKLEKRGRRHQRRPSLNFNSPT
jgi:hypothetical protein